jgi:hypothetical protein
MFIFAKTAATVRMRDPLRYDSPQPLSRYRISANGSEQPQVHSAFRRCTSAGAVQLSQAQAMVPTHYRMVGQRRSWRGNLG